MTINYDSIYNRTYKGCDELKYLHNGVIIGFAHSILEIVPISQRVNPIPTDWINAIYDALHDNFYGGCEPEFETKEQYDSYISNMNNLRNIEWYIDKEDDPVYTSKTPYKDKTFPYIRLKK